MATERNGLSLREAQLLDEVEYAQATYLVYQRRLDDDDRAGFLEHAAQMLVGAPTLKFAEVVGRVDDWGLPLEELAESFENIKRRVQKAYEDLEPYVPEGPAGSLLGRFGVRRPPFADVRARLAINEEDEDLYEKVWQDLVPDISIGLSGISIDPPAISPYNDWVRERDRALENRGRAAGQLDLVRTELAKVSSPKGLGRLSGALAVFLVTGVGMPIAVLVQQPTRLATWQTSLIFGGFAAGLVFVGAAVVLTVREAFPRVPRNVAMSGNGTGSRDD